MTDENRELKGHIQVKECVLVIQLFLDLAILVNTVLHEVIERWNLYKLTLQVINGSINFEILN